MAADLTIDRVISDEEKAERTAETVVVW